MIILNYISLFLLLLSLLFFFFGYVPKTNYKKNLNQNQNYLKKKTIDKVVLVIIDSLRPDMIYDKKNLWVNLYRHLNKSWAYSTIAELQPPSMSLPKIKCIITGSVVNFIDVIFNTDAGKISQENLIDTLKQYRDFRFFLYGDETWAKLFPFQFNSSFLSPPFYVRDFYEVDKKISENIPQLLAHYTAWDFVIMHYVGLDHIGHLVGPYGSYIDGKLKEMDSSINTLINGIFEKKDSDKVLLIVTADHGMSDLGGHGGSSSGELSVPLIFINKRFRENPDIVIENISQNDIAPSLALLLGVPIPSDSIGVIPYKLLHLIEGTINRSEALYSNYLQLMKIAHNIPKSIPERFVSINSSIFEIHQSCKNDSCLEKLKKYHKDLIGIMTEIKVILKTQFIQHNFFMMECATMFSLTAFLISMTSCLIDLGLHASVPGFVLFLSMTLLTMSSFIYESYENCIFNAFKLNIIILMIILTGYTITGTMEIFRFLKTLILEGQVTHIVVIMTTFVNSLSYSFSTFIQKEYQVWFYLSNTLLILYIAKEIIQRILLTKTRVQLKSTYAAAILLLILDRFLTTINKHREHWRKFMNFGDWLNKSENCQVLVTILGICLFVIGWQLSQNNTIFQTIISAFLMVFNGIHRLGDISKNRNMSDTSVWIYYIFIIFYIGNSFYFKSCFKNKCIFKISNIVLLISVLICRDQNVICWTGIVIKKLLIQKIWAEEVHRYNVGIQFVIFNVLGMTSYYQQGNSNSLSTIDVQPGFTGMSEYIAFIVDPVVALHLFSTNLYWIFTWLEWLSEASNLNHSQLTEDKVEEGSLTNTNLESEDKLYPRIVQFITLISSMFSIVLFIISAKHKHSFSAWSIYAPKLLFHSFHNGILLVLYVFIAKLKIL